MLQQVGVTVYFKKAVSYANSNTTMDRVTQAIEASEEESDKEYPITMGHGGLTYLGKCTIHVK
jgi:hypothetical protein